MSTIDLHQRIAVVTGAARGIGRAIACTLLQEGCRVCVTGRDRDAVDEASRDLRSEFGESGRDAPGGSSPELLAIISVQDAKSRAAQPHRCFKDCVEHLGGVTR